MTLKVDLAGQEMDDLGTQFSDPCMEPPAPPCWDQSKWESEIKGALASICPGATLAPDPGDAQKALVQHLLMLHQNVL